jgi:sugar-specific transcriptional regulator TrmB
MKEIVQKLEEVGLTKNQAKIYLSLLKLRQATVKDISKDCGFHRTNIYDILNELMEKSLVSCIKEGKSSIYRVLNPKNMEAIVKEKEETLQEILTQLAKIYSESTEEIIVNVYKGEQGMKIAFNNILKTKEKVFYGINIKGQLREELPIYAKQFYRIMKERNIEYKGIYTVPYLVKGHKTDIRYIEEKYITPVATHIYDDKILIEIWSPTMVAIEIQSRQVAKAYKDQFAIIWKNASRTPIVKE